MTATKQQPIAGYRISDPSDPTIKPWLSDTPDDNGYTSEPLYAGAAPVATFQARVQPWLLACFGAEIAADRSERNHRFLEESLELVQSCGCTASEAHQLVDYVFGRPVGEPAQEAGGVMVTLAALCLANSLDMHEAGETELARIWTKVEAIRAKQAAKPKHSPLPAAPAAVAGPAEPLVWTPGPNEFKDWCAQWFGPDSDDNYLAEAVHALPPMAQRFARLAAAPALEAPAAPDTARWRPDVCPITGRPFFMWIDHWQTGKPVPTYGGPYDSYTIPVKDSDGSFECERYDHDEGGWLTEGAGWHCLGVKLVNDQSFVVDPSNPRYNEIEAFAAAAPQAPAAPVAGMAPRDRETQDQIASVMLQHGTPEQQRQALAYASGAAPAAPAVDAFTHAELLEIQRAVEEFADCNETDVDYDLLMRAAQAGYLECTQFHVLNQSALDLDTVAAAQAKEGGAAC